MSPTGSAITASFGPPPYDVWCAPCTTTIRHLPSEVLLEPGEDPVPLRSAVNLDSLESVSIAILVERLGRLADDRMRQICAALAIAVDCSD
jgi:mRNA interferase MazF